MPCYDMPSCDMPSCDTPSCDVPIYGMPSYDMHHTADPNRVLCNTAASQGTGSTLHAKAAWSRLSTVSLQWSLQQSHMVSNAGTLRAHQVTKLHIIQQAALHDMQPCTACTKQLCTACRKQACTACRASPQKLLWALGKSANCVPYNVHDTRCSLQDRAIASSACMYRRCGQGTCRGCMLVSAS